jgi:hypothetical protein
VHVLVHLYNKTSALIRLMVFVTCTRLSNKKTKQRSFRQHADSFDLVSFTSSVAEPSLSISTYEIDVVSCKSLLVFLVFVSLNTLQ